MPAKRNPIILLARDVICLLIAVTAVGVLFLWILQAVLTRHPSVNMTAPERLKAVNDAGAPLVAFLAAVGDAGTLWFTARTYVLSREGHVTDRYTKAVGRSGRSRYAQPGRGRRRDFPTVRDSQRLCGLFIIGQPEGDVRHIQHRQRSLAAAKSCGHPAVKES